MQDAEYQARFGGIARLFSLEGLARLKAARVCVIGVGGVGSWAVEALARSGVGGLTLIDADDVCTTNINRQLPALTETVGQPKVQVLADRVAAIAPMCSVEAIPDFYTKSNADELLSTNFNFVIDAVDRMSTKGTRLFR